MPNQFIITGPPGSGKTRVLAELERLGYAGVKEPAREIIAEQRAIDGSGLYDTKPQLFCDRMLERAIADHQRLAAARRPAFFDRAIPDMVGYAELFELDTSAAWAASRRCRYEDAVFVLPGWAEIYVTDSERRMTFEAARAFGDRVREIYEGLGYTIVEVPRDSVPARGRFVAEYVQRARRTT